MNNIMNKNELQGLDESINYLNEGKLTDAIKNKIVEKKITKWIKDADYVLKNDSIKSTKTIGVPQYESVINKYFTIVKKYGNTKAFKKHKNEIKKIYDKLKTNHENLVKEAYRNSLLQFKKDWDNYIIDDTWEGAFLYRCTTYGIHSDTIIKHFSKSPKMETYKRMVEIMYGSAEDAEVEYEADYLLNGCSLDDKCIEFYSNDDNIVFFDYNTNKLINLYYDGVKICHDIYKEAGINIEDYEWYDDYEIEIMKEENIKFTA